MNKDQMSEYGYELMVKNNPEEAVKNLILKDKQINNAIEFCEAFKKKFRYDLLKHCHLDEIMDILRGIK